MDVVTQVTVISLLAPFERKLHVLNLVYFSILFSGLVSHSQPFYIFHYRFT